jgi:hypothetical protein
MASRPLDRQCRTVGKQLLLERAGLTSAAISSDADDDLVVAEHDFDPQNQRGIVGTNDPLQLCSSVCVVE